MRRSCGFPDGELVVLTVASLTPVKDHAGLLEAAARLRTQSAVPFRLLFVGEGALRSELERRVGELGLTRHVDMPGASDRVPDLLAAADVFVLPSHLEGMSNAILEAMASGLPVVAKAVGGNPELVVDGETGLLCRPGDPESMAAAIGRLLQDASLRRRMGEAARKRAVETFSIDAMLRNYADYYRRVVGGLLCASSWWGPSRHPLAAWRRWLRTSPRP